LIARLGRLASELETTGTSEGKVAGTGSESAPPKS
jgi:hypothetical protein